MEGRADLVDEDHARPSASRRARGADASEANDSPKNRPEIMPIAIGHQFLCIDHVCGEGGREDQADHRAQDIVTGSWRRQNQREWQNARMETHMTVLRRSGRRSDRQSGPIASAPKKTKRQICAVFPAFSKFSMKVGRCRTSRTRM